MIAISEKVSYSVYEKYGTPCYLFDTDKFEHRAQTVKKAFGDNTGLCYSIKANPFLVKNLPNVFSYIEVCSPGELSICEKASAPLDKIIFSGINKTESDIEHAYHDDVAIFTAESPLHLRLINECALRQGKKAKLILRLSHGSQFGMDAKEIKKIIANKNKYSGCEIIGLHYFTGTQKTKAKTVIKELSCLDEFCCELKTECNFQVQHIEYGPGLAVEYYNDYTENTDMKLLEEVGAEIRKFAEKYPLTVEMGRFFAAECGSYYTTVMDLKTNGDTNYVICDGGINQLNYYGQNMAMKVPPVSVLNKSADCEKMMDYCICGSLCTTADILIRKVTLPELKLGDVICFSRCGAYSVSEGIAVFLSREMPSVILYSKKDGIKVSRKLAETFPFNTP